MLWGIPSLAGTHFCPLHAVTPACPQLPASQGSSFQAPRSPLCKHSFILQPTLAETLSIFLELIWPSFILSGVLPTNAGYAAALLRWGSACLALGPQGPLGRKRGQSGTHLCVSLLSRNTVLHLLLSEKGCFLYFVLFCSYLCQGGLFWSQLLFHGQK